MDKPKYNIAEILGVQFFDKDGNYISRKPIKPLKTYQEH